MGKTGLRTVLPIFRKTLFFIFRSGVVFFLFMLVVMITAVNSLAYAEVRKEYYESGQLKAETSYKNGKKDGIEKRYFENGQLLFETNYKDGKEHGLTKEYYESGGLKYIDTYKKGKKINRKWYDMRGKLEFDQDYPTENETNK